MRDLASRDVAKRRLRRGTNKGASADFLENPVGYYGSLISICPRQFPFRESPNNPGLFFLFGSA